MDSAGGAEAPKAPPLNPPLEGGIKYMKNFDLKRMHTLDSQKNVSQTKIWSRFGWSFSNCELTTRLSDHIDLRIDIILIILSKEVNK